MAAQATNPAEGKGQRGWTGQQNSSLTLSITTQTNTLLNLTTKQNLMHSSV